MYPGYSRGEKEGVGSVGGRASVGGGRPPPVCGVEGRLADDEGDVGVRGVGGAGEGREVEASGRSAADYE